MPGRGRGHHTASSRRCRQQGEVSTDPRTMPTANQGRSSAQQTQRSFQRTSSVTMDLAWNEGDFTDDDHCSADASAMQTIALPEAGSSRDLHSPEDRDGLLTPLTHQLTKVRDDSTKARLLQDILTKYDEVNCVDKTPSVEHRLHRDVRARVPVCPDCTVPVQWRRTATNLKEFTATNFPERDDEQRMKHAHTIEGCAGVPSSSLAECSSVDLLSVQRRLDGSIEEGC